MFYRVKRPKLKTCVITPNPVSQKTSFTIEVIVEEEEIVFQTEYSYARNSNKVETFAGEEGIL